MKEVPIQRGSRVKKALLWGGIAVSAVSGTSVLGLYAAGAFNLSSATPVAVERRAEVSPVVRAFAEEFAHEYFKWIVGQAERRAERLKPFLAKGVDPQAGLVLSDVNRHAVPEVITIREERIQGPGDYVITVSALVHFYNPENTSEYYSRRVMLEVPIREEGERLAVVASPRFIPLPEESPIEVEKTRLAGERVESSVLEEIRTASETFFDTYASGKREELAYLMAEGEAFDTFQGEMEFLRVERLDAVKRGDRVVAEVSVRFRDPYTGMETVSRYEVDWVKKDGRWFVASVR